MTRGLAGTVLVYGLLLAAGTVALQWLEYRFMARAHSLEIYIALVGAVFMALGVWVGARLFRRGGDVAFELNTRVVEALGISERELEVLELLAAGKANKEIAAELGVSLNTVKTHVAKLYGKLNVKRRTEAMVKARELGMIG